MRRFFAIWWAIGVVAIVATGWIWLRIGAQEERARSLTGAILQLERSIGYVGFIHNFKNYVLRPEEDIYRLAAEEDYLAATRAVAQIREAARQAGSDVRLTDLTATIDGYRMHLDAASEAYARGATVREVDQLVRIPDKVAAEEIADSHRKIQGFIESQQQVLWLGQAAGLVLLVGIMFSGTSVLLRLRSTHAAAETERQQENLQVEKANARNLQKVIDQLQLTNRQQAEFAYSISHDLKAPANTAHMLIDAIRTEDGTLDPARTEHVEDLDKVIRRMLELIDGVLTYSRTLDCKAPVSKIRLDDALDEVLSDLRADIMSSGAIIERTPLPEIPANRQQMRQLLQNLVSNALKYREPGKRPRLRISSSGPDQDGMVAIEVQDNGIGIAPEDHDRIFALFGRLHGSETYEGTGLGLPISQRIAAAHGGGIALKSTPGEGTCFTVRLSAHAQPEPSLDAPVAQAG
ncbi:sensor histidine kinase [Antarctobacter jejuensis]|uniref:sensor histidine kinase n=1 Tax=Antarctobacter jejuensis TaxID=1439938 RepID=UPI003FD3B7E1